MDWSTLLSVAVGGLIAIIPVIVANRFQSIERDKDRDEQRRESKTELALDLMKNDVRVIGESIDSELKFLDIFANLRLKKEAGKITDDEMKEKMKQLYLDDESKVAVLDESAPISEKLAYSLGDEFYEEYRKFSDATVEFVAYYRNSPVLAIEESEKVDAKVYKSAAKIHNILKDKLISIKD